MRRRLRATIPAALIALAVAGGCATSGPLAAVGAAVESERTAEAIRIDVALDVANRSSAAFELLDCTYRVSADGRDVYAGRRAVRSTILPSGVARVELPAVVRFEHGAAEARTWRIEGHLWFLGPGVLEAALHDLGIYNPSVTFAAEGPFPTP